MGKQQGAGGGTTTPIQLKTVTIKSTPITKSDSTMVGGKKQSNADVAKAVSLLNKNPSTAQGTGSSTTANIAGKNAASDNINLMIAKRNQLTGGSSNGAQQASN